MTDLVTWLRAQLDDDERVAREATSNPVWSTDPEALDGRVWAEGLHVVAERCYPEDAEHIARHDPARVLAEVDAKRRILDLMMPGRPVYPGAYGQAYRDVLRLLALPYADRPGYREEWRP